MFTFNVDLTKNSITKSILIFALPILISNIFQQLYNTCDVMIVGNLLGDVSLAAIGVSSPVFDLLVGFSLGVGNGFSIVISRFFGANDTDQLKKAVAGSLVIGSLLTGTITILTRFSLIPLLHVLKIPESIIQEAYTYISTITLFIGVMFAYNLLSGFLRAIGNSVVPLIFLMISSITNIILDYLFMGCFHTGIRGAAIATVIAQGISALLCFIYILKQTQILVPQKKDFLPDCSLYKELSGQGFSMGFMMAIVFSGTVILQSGINQFDRLIIAGHTTARKIDSLLTMPLATLSTSVSTFVSQNRGANQFDRIRKGVNIGCCLCIGWALIATFITFTFSESLVQLISGSSKDMLVQYAVTYLKINVPFFLILGILLIMRTSLQGLGFKIVPLISSMIEFIGKIIIVLIFVPLFKTYAIIFSEPLIWVIMTIQLLYSYRNAMKQYS